MKILIVDDHPAIAASLARALQRLGHESLVASGPLEALRLLTADVDAVISDVEMPDLSGAELAQAIRKRFPALPVGFYTASWDQEEIIAHATRVGRVMPKPWRPADLVDLLATLDRAA